MRLQLAPEFANDQQRTFFDSRAPELLYSGAFGAGKSQILCRKAYDLGSRHPGIPIGIFRKVGASLAATTMRTFFQFVVPRGAITKQNKSEGWYELANGSRFWFLGLDADTTTHVPSKVGSLELAFAFVDEAVELTEGDWMMLQGRLRIETAGWMQIAAATNPAGPDHWLKRRFTPQTDDRVFLTASTYDNRFSADAYKQRMAGLTGLYKDRYVSGQWVAVSGGLFEAEWIDRNRHPYGPQKGIPGKGLQPDYQRIVVAVDPAVTSTSESDETGIVVSGLGPDGRAYVLADRSCRLPPHEWAKRVVQAYRDFEADVVVAEVNNGGDLVKEVVRAVDGTLPFKAVHASRGKLARLQPVAAAYAENRVSHVGTFPELESQLCSYDATGQGSPDRADALGWSIHELLKIGGQAAWGGGKAWGDS